MTKTIGIGRTRAIVCAARLVNRRTILLASLAAFASGCTRLVPRSVPTAVPVGAEFEPWNREARAILSDGLETLRTFEAYAAFRVSTADQSERRAPTDLAWDPPSNADWTEATHVARGLHGRAEQLEQRVSTATVDPVTWRQQRDLAAWTHELVDLGDMLKAYRDRIDRLPVGSDATQLWSALDAVWQRWDTSAAHWGVSRAEPVVCAPS